MRRALAIAVALLLLACAAAARAQSPARAAEAKRHLQAGNQLYQDGRYDEAVTELRAGYAIDPRPEFLYALGQVERKRGDCKAAIRYYQQFVDTGQSPQRTVAVLVQIDRCKQELAAAPATSHPPSVAAPPPVAAEPPVTAPPPATAEPPPVAAPAPAVAPSSTAPLRSSERTRIYKRWWVWTIVGVAVAGAAVGLGVGLSQPTFHSTLPDLVIGQSAVRF